MPKMERASAVSENLVYAAVNNIPAFYHSADLRRFFSHFVETKGLDCFHFRHRPEQHSAKSGDMSSKPADKTIKTFCCIIRVKESRFIDLVRTYHQRNWQDGKGDSIFSRCLISRLKISSLPGNGCSTESDNNTDRQAVKYQTRGDQKRGLPDREEFKEDDLLKLPELRPPPLMPNGNVGTPTMHFMKLIQECKLPPSVIKKLQLDFPKSKGKGKYGSVPFDYQTEVVEVEDQDLPVSSAGPDCSGAGGSQASSQVSATSVAGIAYAKPPESLAVSVIRSGGSSTSTGVGTSSTSDSTIEKIQLQSDYREGRRLKKLARKERRMLMDERIEEKMIGFEKGGSDSGEDNDSCEEWERHEAMYNDVTSQDRTKDRLFEEEMEIVWEKGGSGLVFYTDAQYWHEQEGDFDEQTADDLDVDMSAYYENGAGDKDIRDFITIRQEQRRRRGLEGTDHRTAGIIKSKIHSHAADKQSAGIGKFEQYTKGIGRKILEKQGWTDGEGLGSSVQGIADALDSEGQHPRDKKGFGYRVEKLARYGASVSRKRKQKCDVHITTIYDSPAATDPLEPLLRRNDPCHIKHRDRIN